MTLKQAVTWMLNKQTFVMTKANDAGDIGESGRILMGMWHGMRPGIRVEWVEGHEAFRPIGPAWELNVRERYDVDVFVGLVELMRERYGVERVVAA